MKQASTSCFWCRLCVCLSSLIRYTFLNDAHILPGKLFKRNTHLLYICAHVILWMSVTCSCLFNWVYTRIEFVVNNNSPTSMLEVFNGVPAAIFFVPDFVASIISPGLLVKTASILQYKTIWFKFVQIWRCYILWDSIWCVIVLVPLLVVASGVLVQILPKSFNTNGWFQDLTFIVFLFQIKTSTSFISGFFCFSRQSQQQAQQ